MPDVLGYWDRRADDPDWIGDDAFGNPRFKHAEDNIKGVNFYLIRHAEAEVNLSPDIIRGRTNHSQLTLKGEKQAQLLNNKLDHIGLINNLDLVLCSPSLRTFQTMQLVLPDFPLSKIKLEYGLQELDQGDWTGKVRSLAYSSKQARTMQKDHWNFKSPNGESQEEVSYRMKKVLGPHLYDHTCHIAIFSHGGAIKYLCTDLFHWNKQKAWRINVDHASVTHLRYYDNSWKLIKFNNKSFLSSKSTPEYQNIKP